MTFHDVHEIFDRKRGYAMLLQFKVTKASFVVLAFGMRREPCNHSWLYIKPWTSVTLRIMYPDYAKSELTSWSHQEVPRISYTGLTENVREWNISILGMEKRKSAYMRFGRSDPELADQLLMDKRKSAYMRFEIVLCKWHEKRKNMLRNEKNPNLGKD